MNWLGKYCNLHMKVVQSRSHISTQVVYHVRIIDTSIHVCIVYIDVLNYGCGTTSHIWRISIRLYTYAFKLQIRVY